MTTPTNETRGWTGTPGPVAGSRYYTHPHYIGWEIYDAGAGGVITVYQDGETYNTWGSVGEAIDWIGENVVAIERREPASPADDAPAARTFVVEHKAWYAEEIFARRTPRVEAAVSFTTDGADTGWELTWENVGTSRYVGIRLTVLDDAWEAFTLSGFDEIMTAIALGQIDGHNPTVDEVVAVAKRNGWTDATMYETPTDYRRGALR